MDMAEKKWLAIPKEIRDKLLHNVWCSKCRTSVEVIDYVIKEEKFGIVLEGNCNNCGHSVARVVD